ncbi:HvfX family Cu-binding RiPP maturation protein [Halomonas denitrificans]|nr:DoxX family protein [Halomonas denitrificans]
MNGLIEAYDRLTDRLRSAGDWVAPLGLRLLLGYEFLSAGLRKAGVEGVPGWFADKGFPPPFDWFPAGMNWAMVTWIEVLAAIALMLGLLTRFFAFSLFVVTTIAIVSTHWPSDWNSLSELWKGYAVSNDGFGNYRIPLLFMAMLLPLVFMGGGKLSLDHALVKLGGRADLVDTRRDDLLALALALLVPGIALVYLIPLWGVLLIVAAALSAFAHSLRG